MSAHGAVERRVLRRETHPSRTVPAVLTAVALAALAAGVLVVAAWALADSDFRDRAGAAALRTTTAIGSAPSIAAVVAGGGLAAALGIVLICSAALPGRLPRRGRRTDRLAVVVDDALIADAAVDAVAAASGIAREQVSASIGRRVLDVRVTPSSGMEIDVAEAQAAARATVEHLGAPVRVGITVARRGVIA